MKSVAAVLSLSLLLLATACETQHPSEPATIVETEPLPAPVGLYPDLPGVQDSLFVEDALNGADVEINLAHLAIVRAHNTDLRLLAQRIIDDHTRANEDLGRIIQQELTSVETPTNHFAVLDQLRNLSGSKFDQMYVRHLVTAHKEEIKKFQAASRTARNSDVREFASRNLPVLEEHLRIAENIDRMAGLSVDINEPAGAERPAVHADPYYQGDPQLPHQFNERVQ